MLVTTKFVALVLVFTEIDGAVEHKNIQQAAVGGPKKGNGQLSVADDPASPEEVEGGQHNTMGYHYPAGYSYGAMGADGTAEVAFKIDMSLFMQKMDMIPELRQIVVNLSQKVDMLIYHMGPGGQSGQGGLGAQIIALEQSIIARMDQQDSKINALYQLIQQYQGELGTVNQEINQILAILQSLKVGGSPGSGGGCVRKLAVIQGLIQQMMATLAQVVEIIQQIGQVRRQEGLSGQGTEIVQQNFRLLQQVTTMIEQISQQIGQGVACTRSSPGGTTTEMQILQEMSSVMALIEKVPQQILIVLQNSGLLGGSNGALVQYLQKIMQTCESIINEVITVKNNLAESGREIKRHFTENQKSLVAVRKVVTETTEMVKSSAVAAISVGRSLKCPTSKNKKPDLDS